MKKIAVIGLKGLPSIGGAASVGQNLIDHLSSEYDFTVYSLSNYIGEKSDREYKQIVWKSSKTSGLNTFFYYLKSAFHAVFVKKFDLIHLHHAESGFILPILKLRYKVVVTFHGIFEKNDPKFGKLANFFFRQSMNINIKYADALVTVSKPSLDYLQRKSSRSIFYISNGVSIHEIDLPKMENVIVFSAARVYSIKGLHLLIEALEINNFRGRLIVIGSFDHEKEYEMHIKNMIKTIDVQFVGLVREKTALFNIIAQSSLFVFPSLSEAMSMMLLEVAALKIPIVASDIAGVRAIFNEDEITYFISENSLDLARKLSYAIANSELIKLKALAAYRKVKSEYSWPSIACSYSKIFNEYIK